MTINLTARPESISTMSDRSSMTEDYSSRRTVTTSPRLKTLLESDMEILRITMLTSMRFAQQSIRLAIRAITNRDTRLARQVLVGDKEIDRREIGIDAMVLRLLALHQPVARDLRYIVGSMRISGNIERMGDEAVNIARRVDEFNSMGIFSLPEPLIELSQLAQSLVQKAITAFSDLDINLAETIGDQNDDAINLNVRLFREMLNDNPRNPRQLERAVVISFLTHNIKRVCDQAENIGESVIFIKKGVNCKHTVI